MGYSTHTVKKGHSIDNVIDNIAICFYLNNTHNFGMCVYIMDTCISELST